jgi:disulfide oxidoreductase YuzD
VSRDEPILVQILDDSREDGCPGCAPPWLSWRAAKLANEYLQRIYGDSVLVSFIDLASSSFAQDEARLAEQVQNKGLTLPVVAIDGKLRLSGVLDFGRIADAIETLREVTHG